MATAQKTGTNLRTSILTSSPLQFESKHSSTNQMHAQINNHDNDSWISPRDDFFVQITVRGRAT